MSTTSSATHSHPAPAHGPSTDVRQYVSFSFYHLDQEWRRLPKDTRQAHARELLAAGERFKGQSMTLSYSLVGLKSNVDFLIWRVGENLELLQQMSAAVLKTGLGGYLSTPYNYLSMTRRSVYVDKLDPDHPEKRRFITPAKSKYLFVYPFVKTDAWYQLPYAQRQTMMDEHILVGNKYPSVKIHTTYSFGLDDPEFVLAFESDEPKDFLDLVLELREAKGRPFTKLDTPIFTCVAKPLPAILEELGA